jgi:hypothetical protein
VGVSLDEATRCPDFSMANDFTISFRGGAVAASLCDSPTTTVAWRLKTEPVMFDGVRTDVVVVGKEVRYRFTIAPACDGTVQLEAHEHGRRVKGSEGNQPVVSFGGTTSSGSVSVLFPGGNAIDAGASLRVNRDSVEVCRMNDGAVRPPGPGNWSSAANFDNYNLTCNASAGQSLGKAIVAGGVMRFELFRWNTNAEPNADAKDGYRFQVTFVRK